MESDEGGGGGGWGGRISEGGKEGKRERRVERTRRRYMEILRDSRRFARGGNNICLARVNPTFSIKGARVDGLKTTAIPDTRYVIVSTPPFPSALRTQPNIH